MKSRHVFFTPTLAGLYYRQGYYDEASKAYAWLLERDPANEEYVKYLRLIQSEKSSKGDLKTLVGKWAQLLRKEALLLK